MKHSTPSTALAPLAATVLLVPLLGACDQRGDEHPAGTQPAELYRQYCSDCHLENGKGVFLKGTPNLQESRLSREAVITLILKGDSAHHRMPDFPRMARSDAEGIADHVLDLAGRGGGP